KAIDWIGLGEIRGSTEARLAMEAAHTGRLVIAGLHAGSCVQARQRMVDLGIDEHRLDATLRAVLYQELGTRRCDCAADRACLKCRGVGRYRALHAELELAS